MRSTFMNVDNSLHHIVRRWLATIHAVVDVTDARDPDAARHPRYARCALVDPAAAARTLMTNLATINNDMLVQRRRIDEDIAAESRTNTAFINERFPA